MSSAGRRAGIKAGTRSGLWSVFADAIDALRPTWVVIENVRGLLSATAHRTVEDDAGRDVEPAAGVMGDGAGRPVLRAAGAVLGDLADLGYDAQWATVAAADVGAPHRRERVFIVAHTSGAAIGEPAGSASAEETRQGSGDRSGNRGGERTVADGRQSCGCGDRRIDHDWFANPDRFDDGGCRRCRCEGFWPSGDEAGVALLPTPNADVGRGVRSPEGIAKRIAKGDKQFSLEDAVALLPTPTSSQGRNETSGRQPGSKHNTGTTLNDVVFKGEIGGMLPTPRATDGTDGPVTNCPSVQAICDGSAGRAPRLSEMAAGGMFGDEPGVALLPTPNASDGSGGGQHPDKREGHSRQLIDYVLAPSSQWGKYEPAIRRWEALVGPAPAPTEPNKNGNPRLSAAFSEWLMGWPQGWVTDPAIGISRNDQLRIIGNGVCPQQAIAALQLLLRLSEVTP